MNTLTGPGRLEFYWGTLSFALTIGAIANIVVFTSIAGAPHLRKMPFNFMIMMLCVPDTLFSVLCLTNCFPNFLNNGWHGGSLMCDWQAAYVAFCVCCSCWMSCMISYFIKRSVCYTGMQAPALPKVRQLAQINAVIIFVSLLLGCLGIIEGLPVKANTYHGLLCAYQEYDSTSFIVVWVWLVLIAFLPAGILTYNYFCVYKKLTASAGSKEDDKMKKLAWEFLTYFAVFLGFWAPCVLGIWVVSVEPDVMFVGGLIGHMQGAASTLMYARKADINKEIIKRYPCLACIKGISTMTYLSTVAKSGRRRLSRRMSSSNSSSKESPTMDPMSRDYMTDITEVTNETQTSNGVATVTTAIAFPAKPTPTKSEPPTSGSNTKVVPFDG